MSNRHKELLIKAEFNDQLPPPLQVPSAIDSELNRVLDRIAILRRTCARYTERITSKKATSTYVTDMQLARSCADYKDSKQELCSPILLVLKLADVGTAIGGAQTEIDLNLIGPAKAFFKEYDEVAAPTLIPRYERGDIPLSELFGKLKSLSDKFDAFRSELWSYAEHHKKDDAEFKTAANFMQKHFYHAMMISEEEFFPLLRKNVLEVRFARIEEAAKLLALHGDEIKGFDAKEELRHLGNDLVCLTDYPVGPAFDAKYSNN